MEGEAVDIEIVNGFSLQAQSHQDTMEPRHSSSLPGRRSHKDSDEQTGDSATGSGNGTDSSLASGVQLGGRGEASAPGFAAVLLA